MKATDAVDPLIKAAEKPLPIKSRANSARIAAMRALVKIGDKRAVPTLMKILTTSADEQDFLLNQKAALGLAEFRDPQAIPALIKGLFMTGRGTGIFQECRLALVRIGAPGGRSADRSCCRRRTPTSRRWRKQAEVRRGHAGRGAAQGGHPARRPARQEGGPRADRRACTRRRAATSTASALIALGYIATPAGRRRDPRRSEGRQGRPGRARLGRRRAVPVGRSAGRADAAGDREVRLRDDGRPEGVRPARQRRHRPGAHRRQGDLRRRSRRWPTRRPRSRACSAWRWTACRSPRSATDDVGCYGKKLNDPSLDARREGGVRDRASRATPRRACRCCSAR